MEQNQLIKHIAEQAGLSEEQATSALQAFETAVIDELANDGEVSLIGFGTFCAVKQRVERTSTGINQSLTDNIILEQKVPHFKAGEAFKDAIN